MLLEKGSKILKALFWAIKSKLMACSAQVPDFKDPIGCDFAAKNPFDGYIETGLVSDVFVNENRQLVFFLNGRLHSVFSEKPNWFVSGIRVEITGRNGKVEITQLEDKAE